MQKVKESVLCKTCVLGSCAPTWRQIQARMMMGGRRFWSIVTVRCVSSSVNMSRRESEGRNKRRSPERRDIKTRWWPRNGACVSCVRKQQQQQQQWALWHMAQAAVCVGDGCLTHALQLHLFYPYRPRLIFILRVDVINALSVCACEVVCVCVCVCVCVVLAVIACLHCLMMSVQARQ